jgi:uncharacterized membrane protein
MKTQLWAILLVFIGTIIGSFGSLFFKLGAKDLNFNIKQQLKNYKLMLGFVFYGVSSIFYISALKGGELSVIYPLVSLAYIWIIFISIKILKEKMNLLKWLGIAGIALGVVFIGLGM